MRCQPWTTSVPQLPSAASCSLVVVLRREISTVAGLSSSLALPANFKAPPGATARVGAGVGGVIGAGALTATVGAAASR